MREFRYSPLHREGSQLFVKRTVARDANLQTSLSLWRGICFVRQKFRFATAKAVARLRVYPD